MAVAAFVVSLIALLVAGASAAYARTQAKAAKNEDLRARRPTLVVTLDQAVNSQTPTAVYYIENQGREDLDSVVVYRPVTEDGVKYQVAKMGTDFGDSAEVGPLEIKAKQALVLSIGTAESLPEFRVRIKCRIGKDVWEDAHVLEDPRFHIGVY
jgi:hypothetical protein